MSCGRVNTRARVSLDTANRAINVWCALCCAVRPKHQKQSSWNNATIIPAQTALAWLIKQPLLWILGSRSHFPPHAKFTLAQFPPLTLFVFFNRLLICTGVSLCLSAFVRVAFNWLWQLIVQHIYINIVAFESSTVLNMLIIYYNDPTIQTPLVGLKSPWTPTSWSVVFCKRMLCVIPSTYRPIFIKYTVTICLPRYVWTFAPL